MTVRLVSELELFRAAHGLDLTSNVKRTLAHCLYWMQHATHEEGGMPKIWKSGPELEGTLSIAARTANRHLKLLAAHGFWALSYKAKPGTIGPVSWLTLGAKGADLIELARDLGPRMKTGRRVPADGALFEPPIDADATHQASQVVTSKHNHKANKTAKKPASFLLSGEAKKEAIQANVKELPGVDPVPPKFVNVGGDAKAFAKLANESLVSQGLRKWDWSSRYTWAHVDEIVSKLKSRGLQCDDWAPFLSCVLENWSWMRTGISHRYAWHDTNLHAPSPMAFAHEFDQIYSMFETHKKPAKKTPTFTSMDEGFF